MKFAPPFSPKKISIPVKIVHRIQRRENWINSKKRERERIYRSGASFQFLLQDKRKNWGGEVERGGWELKKKKKSQADAINKSGKLLRPRSEIHGIQSFRFTTFPRGAKQGLWIAACAPGAAERDKSESLHLSRGIVDTGEGKGGGNCLSIASKIDDIASRKIKPARVLRADKIIGNREGWDRWRYEGRKGEEEEPITRTASWNPMLDLLYCIRAVLRLVVYLYRDPTRRLFRVNDEYLYTRSSRVTCRHCVPALVRRIESRVNWKTFLE